MLFFFSFFSVSKRVYFEEKTQPTINGPKASIHQNRKQANNNKDFQYFKKLFIFHEKYKRPSLKVGISYPQQNFLFCIFPSYSNYFPILRVFTKFPRYLFIRKKTELLYIKLTNHFSQNQFTNPIFQNTIPIILEMSDLKSKYQQFYPFSQPCSKELFIFSFFLFFFLIFPCLPIFGAYFKNQHVLRITQYLSFTSKQHLAIIFFLSIIDLIFKKSIHSNFVAFIITHLEFTQIHKHVLI